MRLSNERKKMPMTVNVINLGDESGGVEDSPTLVNTGTSPMGET